MKVSSGGITIIEGGSEIERVQNSPTNFLRKDYFPPRRNLIFVRLESINSALKLDLST